MTDYLTGPVPGTFAETFITFNATQWASLPADFQAIILEEGVLHSERAKEAALKSDLESEGDLIELGMEHSNFTTEMMEECNRRRFRPRHRWRRRFALLRAP